MGAPSNADDYSRNHHPCCLGMSWGRPVEPHPTTWTTEDKRVLAFEDMSDRHLLLTIRLMIRRASHDRAWACIDTLAITWDCDHDDVAHGMNQLYDQTWEDRTCAHYKPMLEEARRRELKNASSEFLSAYGKKVERYTQRIEALALCEIVKHKGGGGEPVEVTPRPKRWFNA